MPTNIIMAKMMLNGKKIPQKNNSWLQLNSLNNFRY